MKNLSSGFLFVSRYDPAVERLPYATANAEVFSDAVGNSSCLKSEAYWVAWLVARRYGQVAIREHGANFQNWHRSCV